MNRRLGDQAADSASPEAEELYRLFTTGERAAAGTDFSLRSEQGGLTGPPAAWLLAPRLGLALEPLGQAVRFGLSLPRRLHEIVILFVARAEDNDFERWAHTRAARAAGLTEEEIAGLLDGSAVTFEDVAEATASRLAAALLAGGPLDDVVFDDAVAVLGRPAVFEIVTLVGYYRMMALQLRAFDIRPPS